MAALPYHVMSKEVENHIFRHNWIFRHTCMYKHPHWQSSGIIIFLCKYDMVISDILVGSFLDVFFLLHVLWSLCNMIRALWETKKLVTEKST